MPCVSGHRAACVWLLVAAIVGAAALTVLVFGTFIRPDLIERAAAWVALFSVYATIIAIVAAYAELRTVFPRQVLSVDVGRAKDFRDASGTWKIDHTWVIIRNDESNALVNAFRLEVRIENANGTVPSFDEHDDVHRHFLETRWLGTPWMMETIDGPPNYLFRWVRQGSEPFFPGTTICAPPVPIEEGMTHWRVTWWTDRAGPREVTLPIRA